MKLNEIRQHGMFTTPNYHVVGPRPEFACVEEWWNKYYPVRTRGEVRKRFSKMIGILRKYNIPMWGYGNNDGGYAYKEIGVCIKSADVTNDILKELLPYVDGVTYLMNWNRNYTRGAVNDNNVYIGLTVRWFKEYANLLGRYYYWGHLFEAIRIIEKTFPNYTNK